MQNRFHKMSRAQRLLPFLASCYIDSSDPIFALSIGGMSVDQIPISIASIVLSTSDMAALKSFVADGTIRYLSIAKTKWFQVMKSALNALY